MAPFLHYSRQFLSIFADFLHFREFHYILCVFIWCLWKIFDRLFLFCVFCEQLCRASFRAVGALTQSTLGVIEASM